MPTPFEAWLKSKGIRKETADAWGVEDRGNEAHFKYPQGTKVRYNLSGGERKFSFNGTQTLYHLSEPLRETVFLVEGESDALRLWQEFQGTRFRDKVSVVGLPGLTAWKDEYANLFSQTRRLRVVFDNDSGYAQRDAADKAYQRIRSAVGVQRVRRINLRPDVKDVVEHFQKYSFASFVELAKPSNTTHFQTLDLNKEPPHPEWLVEGFLCEGDVALLAGPPGIGKSLFAQALSVAVAQGNVRFLGLRLHATGPVMYLDRENPQDVIYDRLRAFGLRNDVVGRLHYYHRPEAYLDRSPEKLLDDALLIQPKLIVLDSLVGFHQQEENSAGAMRHLFMDGIIPLARETGAAVLVLHHSGKGGDDSYKRIRGSGDIQAAADNVIELTRTLAVDDTGKEREAINLHQDKTRRSNRGKRVRFFIDTNVVGDVALTPVRDGFDE